MKRFGFFLTFLWLAPLWFAAIYVGLVEGRTIPFILCMIVLLPVTIRVVYNFLLSRSTERDERRSMEMYERSMQDTYAPSAGCFCPSCGAKNEASASFCASCGGRLN